MRVLVAAASKHGGTTEIARAIGTALTEARLETDVKPVDEVTTLESYDAVVLGSGVYMGRWLEPAKRFVERNATALATRPVWLFSSGPLGDPPKPAGEPADVLGYIERTHARDHRVFPGVLDKGALGLGERTIVAAVRAPAGDYRPWDEVKTWALGIARELGHPA
jgi:menaquinone-dependent protoporphyrinogen oxidase